MTKAIVVVVFSVVVWAFCGAIMGIGPRFISMDATLVVHAIGGPLGAAIASYFYFRFFGTYGPLTLAAAFVATALLLDFFAVSPIFVGNYSMFSSILGLWIPMALIYAATWMTGFYTSRRVQP